MEALSVKEQDTSTTTHISKPIDDIKARRSQELIIGLCGAIGSGTRDLEKNLALALEQNGYKVEIIKISDLIPNIKSYEKINALPTGYDRYEALQNAGNELREKYGNSVLAEIAVKEIIGRRATHTEGIELTTGKTKQKIAYIVNQLKHDEEAQLLQTVYRQNFYMIGINSTEHQRRSLLKISSISDKNINTLIERDRKEAEDSGQQVEKTFHQADYFIHNDGDIKSLKEEVLRFIDLVHGINGKTPSKDEKGMYEAFSASLQSACLSRQVGAAIMNLNGEIISTGCNDVPAFKGGLYTPEHGATDKRCFFKGGICYNDLHKSKLQNQFEEILKDNGITNSEELAKKLMRSSRAKDIIEYSRAIHAEMSAILQLARSPSTSSIAATIYCTTYPCHNCARHIVAAGISRAVYIEPYEKSLALDLHDDAISHSKEPNKVSFEPFEGVSPKRYLKFFYAGKRKDGGKAIQQSPKDSHHADPQYLDSVVEYEGITASKLAERNIEMMPV